jgi:hypothetical protein
MVDRDPLPEGWVDMTHPDGSGEVSRVRTETFDNLWSLKGWVTVDTDEGQKLAGGAQAPLDPLLANESDEVKDAARKRMAEATKEPTADDLREQARKRGLSTSGAKHEIEARIAAHDAGGSA